MFADAGQVLIPIARSVIARAFGECLAACEDAAWLKQPGATFVTLRTAGELRGCVGTVQAHQSVAADVKSNALGAAFRDTRFAPLTAAEFDATAIEISLLSALERIEGGDEEDLLSRLRPNADGLVLEYARQRATFLPQVWEQLPEPRRFVSHLKMKAGLAPDFWSREIQVSRYTVTKWSEAQTNSLSPLAGRD
jgi:uncharacterized protein